MELLAASMSTAGELGREITVVQSVESLFRAHYGRLVRALTLASGSREAAADAVQEAFVKAHLHWRRIQRYDDPVAWIRRVAINGLRDDHRRQGRSERVDQRLRCDAATAPVPDDAGWADDDGAAAMLRTLPRQQRLAMALYYVDGMSVAEVAEAMKLTAGAVKYHLHQGRERLRSCIATGTRALVQP